MKYKGYAGRVEFDDEAGIFHGEVINLRDVITFQGRSVDELKKAFKESIDDYLEFCTQRNEEPEKPFSGEVTIKVEPELHRNIYLRAQVANKSLNSWMNEVLKSALKTEPVSQHW
ncbi:type II toxin-antitoxin system HicB family antitoxin [bacterium]|nr:type II toxin-antitoxin system HicB family antitoxin [bacterium]